MKKISKTFKKENTDDGSKILIKTMKSKIIAKNWEINLIFLNWVILKTVVA